MKKLITLFIFTLVSLLLTSCTVGYKINNFEALKYKIDGLEYDEEAKINYFESSEDFEKIFYTDYDSSLSYSYFSKYDESYFKNNSLILISVKDYKENEYFAKSNGIKNGTISINRFCNNESELVNWTLVLEIEDKIPDINHYIVSFQNLYNGINHTHNIEEYTIPSTCKEKGYTVHVCSCGYEYKDNFTDILECKYENDRCIWCNKEAYAPLIDGTYVGIQIGNSYKNIDTFYHDPYLVKDGKLYSYSYCYGLPTKLTLEENLFDYSSLSILEGYHDIVQKLSIEKKVYGFDEILSGYNKSQIFIICLNDVFYLVTINKRIATDEIVSLNIDLLNDKLVSLWFISETGGCVIEEYFKFVEKDKEYVIDFTQYAFFTDIFINVDTLKIYNKVIYADDHMKLVPYDESEGIFYMYIIDYLLKYGNFHFDSQYVNEEEITEFEKTILDENKIIIEIDNIEYTLYKEFSYYLIREIKINDSIFASYEEDERVLSILFGSSNSDFDKTNISVMRNDGGYIIKLGHPPIAG